MWGGRFGKGPAAIMEAINASIEFDQRLAGHDLAGSRAHAQMLADRGIVSAADGAAILKGLAEIEAEIAAGRFVFKREFEDIHLNIEARLAEIAGPAAGRLHTARSRNDQVATDLRLWVREACERADAGLLALARALLAQAERHAGTIMPGFTHMQPAQPVTFGHHCLAYGEMFARDRARFADARARIDSIDRSIQELIAERAGWAQQVGKAKGPLKAAVEYYRPERESQVLRMVIDRNNGPLADEVLVRLFREIMSACLAQQEPLKVAFLGPEGTFTQAAVFKQFGSSVRALPLPAIDEVFHEVEAGVADFGVVPIENSTEGTVNHTLDMFLASPLKICGEVEMRIHHHLMGRMTGIPDIKRVCAHPQALAQCRGWLDEHLSDVERVPVASNAEGARRARDERGTAAIAAKAAAEIYGLAVLANEIEDRPDNTTRFLVVGRKLFGTSGKDKTTLLVSGSATEVSGALFRLLEPLTKHKVNMTRIESRPSRKRKWDYVFFIDIEGHVSDKAVKRALAALERRASLFKVLGSYPRAIL